MKPRKDKFESNEKYKGWNYTIYKIKNRFNESSVSKVTKVLVLKI